MRAEVKRQLFIDLRGLVILSIVSLAVGLVINQVRSSRLPWIYQDKQARVASSVDVLRENPSRPREQIVKEPNTRSLEVPPDLAPALTLAEFVTQVEKAEVLILDVRPKLFYRLGHVPGAVSLPRNDFQAVYAEISDTLVNHQNRPVILHCASVDCEDAELVRDALSKLGYRKLSIFPGGWSEWHENGHKVESHQ